MSLILGFHHAILNVTDENGFTPDADGSIVFHFNHGTSVMVTAKMAKKIQATFSHVKKSKKSK
jgi:predicted 3-demethylubiquinone-9 3-methyltransferase (glyoxalase superfamily)